MEPSADRIPGALERVVAAGVTYNSATGGAYAALRLRHFGAYPLIEDNSVRATATTLLNASADDAAFVLPGGVWEVVLDSTHPRGRGSWHGQGHEPLPLPLTMVPPCRSMPLHQVDCCMLASTGMERPSLNSYHDTN